MTRFLSPFFEFFLSFRHVLYKIYVHSKAEVLCIFVMCIFSVYSALFHFCILCFRRWCSYRFLPFHDQTLEDTEGLAKFTGNTQESNGNPHA